MELIGMVHVYSVAVSPRQTRIALGCHRGVHVHDLTKRGFPRLRGLVTPHGQLCVRWMPPPLMHDEHRDDEDDDGEEEEEEEDNDYAFDAQCDVIASGVSQEPVLRRFRPTDGEHGQLLWVSAAAGFGAVWHLVVLPEHPQQVVLSGGNDGLVTAWDGRAGERLFEVCRLAATLQGLCLVPLRDLQAQPTAVTRRQLVTVDESGLLRLWQLDVPPTVPSTMKAEEVYSCFVDLDEFRRVGMVVVLKYRGLAVSPDGKMLAVSCLGCVVQLLQLETGKPVVRAGAGPQDGKRRTVLAGHTADVRSLQFSPCGQLLISCSMDCSARVWDIKTCSPVDVIEIAPSWVRQSALLANGTILACDGNARLHTWQKEISSTTRSRLAQTALFAARREYRQLRHALAALEALSRASEPPLHIVPLPVLVLDCFVVPDARLQVLARDWNQ